MKLKNQVCSLELARKLKELGVKQESYFWWTFRKATTKSKEPKWMLVDGSGTGSEYYSAFTVAEMGERLPIIDGYSPVCSKHPAKWQCGYLDNEQRADHMTVLLGKFFEADTEADARAKTLCYLLENKLTSPDV
jgi:hypothetical protein